MIKPRHFEVIVTGAGAVGLLLGNLLGKHGVSALVLEKEGQVRKGSRSIGITPPSLEILNPIGLDQTFIQNGVKIRRAIIHGNKHILGYAVFDTLPSAYAFILSLPQEQVERLLEDNLKKYPSTTLLREREAVEIRTDADQVQVKVLNKKMQTQETYTANFLCACDGKNSAIRERMKIPFIGGRYRPTFLMADFHDETSYGNDAHLFFTHHGPVESFPLPGNKRRWIIDTPAFLDKPDPGYLEDEIWRRVDIRLDPAKKLSENPFKTEHYQSAVYYRDRVIFCGDAAHVMSPIGGQGMNTGFADAEFCAHMLFQIISHRQEKETSFADYQRYRRQAAAVAMRRAAFSMTIGTMQGRFLSGLRNLVLQLLLRLWKKKIPRHFSMLSLPYHSLALVKERLWSKDKNSF